MDIDAIVNRAYTSWAYGKGTAWTEHMRAAITELSAAHAIELRAYEATVANQAERIRQLEAERVPEGWQRVPSRCPLCEYQYGHQIGCENNPVDIALRADAQQPKKEGE